MDQAAQKMLEVARQASWWPTIVAHAWVILLSMLGGVVSYIQKVRSGQCSRFNVTELIGEIITSGFAGLLTYLFCEAAGINLEWTAFMVGVSGHMGARAVMMFERYLGKRFDLPVEPPKV